jgi:hypothetical protein
MREHVRAALGTLPLFLRMFLAQRWSIETMGRPYSRETRHLAMRALQRRQLLRGKGIDAVRLGEAARRPVKT